MDKFDLTRMVIALAFVVIIGFYSLAKLGFKKNPFTTKFLTRTAIFAAISIILYIVPYFKFSIPGLFPTFLEIHLDEIPALIAGFAYGPLSGIIIILVKTIVKLPMTTTLCVGELADLIYSVAFVLPAALIYKHHRTFKGMLVSVFIAMIVQIFTASLVTSFVILNFYMSVMQLPESAILAMCKAANPNCTSLGWTFFWLIGVPFNALKDAIVVVATIILYKRLIKVINRFTGAQKNQAR